MNRRLVVVISFVTLMTIVIGHAEDLEGRKHFSEVLMEATFAIEGSHGGLGTCFAVGCTDSTAFIITARHVLDSMRGDTAIVHYRLRLPNGSFEDIPHRIPIRAAGNKLYVVSPDSSIDIAALRMSFPKDSLLKFQLMPIHRSLLATDQDVRKYWLHPGDEVFYLGYPLATASSQGLFPILRAGFISSYPFIPLRDNPFVYLDGPVYEGNSGGPVYFEYTLSQWNGRAINQDAKLLGVVSFYKSPEAKRKIDTVKQKHDIQLGGFVSSAFISELLDSAQCK